MKISFDMTVVIYSKNNSHNFRANTPLDYSKKIGIMGTIIIAVIAVAFAIWAMVDISNSSLHRNQKVGWFAAVILIPIAGPIIYYFMGRY
jgi:hypothetical protein